MFNRNAAFAPVFGPAIVGAVPYTYTTCALGLDARTAAQGTEPLRRPFSGPRRLDGARTLTTSAYKAYGDDIVSNTTAVFASRSSRHFLASHAIPSRFSTPLDRWNTRRQASSGLIQEARPSRSPGQPDCSSVAQRAASRGVSACRSRQMSARMSFGLTAPSRTRAKSAGRVGRKLSARS